MMTVFFCRHYASEMIVSAPSVMGSAMLMVFFRTNRPIISSFFLRGRYPKSLTYCAGCVANYGNNKNGMKEIYFRFSFWFYGTVIIFVILIEMNSLQLLTGCLVLLMSHTMGEMYI